MSTNFAGLSFTGDGKTPSAIEAFDNARKLSAKPVSFGVGSTSSGGVSWTLPLSIPPALLLPEVGLSYSAGSGFGWVGRDFQVQGGIDVRRPTGSAARQYADLPGVLVVSGGGMNGLLIPTTSDPNAFHWYSHSPSRVVATLDPTTWTLTVHSGMVTSILVPRADVDWATHPVDPWHWHTTLQEDTGGNRVEYTWAGDRLDSVRYGGTLAQDPLVEIAFDYEPAPHASTRAENGVLDWMDERLVAIEVRTRSAAETFSPRLVYEIGYGLNEEHLEYITSHEVSLQGVAGPSRSVATFEYTELSESAEIELNTASGLGRTVSHSASRERSDASEHERLVDMSGDGLLDALGTEDVGWQRLTGYGHAAAHWFETEGEAHAYGLGSFDRNLTVVVNEEVLQALEYEFTRKVSATYGMSRLLDLDGDGYLDVIETAEEPLAHADGFNPDAAAINREYTPTWGALPGPFGSEWTVSYGGPTGPAEQVVVEAAPFKFLSVGTRPMVEDVPIAGLEAFYDYPGEEVALRDMNGDGQIDIVEFVHTESETELYVHLRLPGRGAGWAQPEMWGVFDQGTTARATRGYVAESQLGYEFDQGHDQHTPAIGYTETRTDWVDVNGDGLPDFVDARLWTPAAPVWTVYLNTGVDVVQTAIWWAPVGWLSRAAEGMPWLSSCSIGSEDLSTVASALMPYGDLAIVALEDAGAAVEEALGPGTDSWCNEQLGADELVLGELVDWNGDGRVDLVWGEAPDPLGGTTPGAWYKNLGDGFELAGSTLPAWVPRQAPGSLLLTDPAESAILGVGQTHQTVVVSVPKSIVNAETTFDFSEEPVTGTRRIRLLAVMDLDADGLPDVIDNRMVGAGAPPEGPHIAYGGREVTSSGTLVGGGTRPGLLAYVVSGTGAVTHVTYVSSASLSPAGTLDPQTVSSHRDVLERLEVVDPVTGHGWFRTYTYQDAAGSGGMSSGLWGFGEIAVDDYAWNPDRTDLGWRWQGGSTATYDVRREGPLVLEEHVSTAHEGSVVDGSALPVEHARVSRTYAYYNHAWAFIIGTNEPVIPDQPALSPSPECNGLLCSGPWPRQITVQEFGEIAGSSAVPDNAWSWSVEVTYDEAGNAVRVVHDDPARPQDHVEVVTEWVPEDDGLFYVPRSRTTSMPDPLDLAATIDIESGVWSYDDLGPEDPPTVGRLTTQEICGGPIGNLCSVADEVESQFGYSARGALVSSVLIPGGRDRFVNALGFGDTVPTDEENALGHAQVRAVDDLGRVVLEIDPNGVEIERTYDAYGRVLTEHRQGSGGSVLIPVSETVYHDDSVPAWVETTTYTVDDEGVVTGQRTDYTVLDGLGRPLQSWRAKLDRSGFVVSETELDLRGDARFVSEPHQVASFSLDYASTRGSAAAALAWFDALGGPVESWSSTGGTTLVEYPAPGLVRSTDAEGYVKELQSDTHGRLVTVAQGRGSNPLTPTGAYTWDGRGRLLSFTDGNGNVHRYEYDGAGRRRQVWRTAPGEVEQPYMGFVWEGPDPIEQYEGVAGDLSALVATWTYDPLGRTIGKQLWDPVAGDWQVYGWVWDTAWVGARQATTDPLGTTTYHYDPLPVVGGFGWPTKEERTWSGSPLVAAISRVYDANGRVTRTTWPSGAQVDTTYWSDGPPSAHGVTYGAGGLAVVSSVSLSYDELDRPDGWTYTIPKLTGDLVWSQDVTYGPRGRVEGLVWSEAHGAGDHVIDYTFYANGWPHEKYIDGMEPLVWSYDDLGRVDELSHDGVMLESYTYDPAGNPTRMMRDDGGAAGGPPDEDWTYAMAVPRFSEVLLRTRPKGASHVTDQMTYETQTSRLATWTTDDPDPALDVTRSFAYDGAGRLRQVTRDGIRITNFRYDVDDQLVYEQRTIPGPDVTVYRFGGWRREGASTVEAVLPMLRVENGTTPRVVYTEPDGHANWTLGTAAGQADTENLIGVYGLDLLKFPKSGNWLLDGFHGSEPDRTQEVTQFGVRHMAMRDGMWMQPEPLLYLGLQNGHLSNPLGFGGQYAGGGASRLGDRDGFSPTALAQFITAYTNPEIDPASDRGGYARAVAGNYAKLGAASATVYGAGAAAPTLLRAGATVYGGLSVRAYLAAPVAANGLRTVAEVFDESGAGTMMPDVPSPRARIGGCSGGCSPAGCFVSGTAVLHVGGSAEIDAIETGLRAISHGSAASTDGEQEPAVELEDARPSRRGARAPRALCVLLAACGPELGEPVQTYDARTGYWDEAAAALAVGDEYLVDGHLYRVTADGVEDRGEATVEDLAASDETWVAEAAHRVPDGDEWVLVLGAADDAGHWRLAEVEPGERFAFQGRVFDTADADGDGRLEVRATGDVIGRVYQTHVRRSDTVIDLVVSGPGGPETITGTPEHPFWVPAVGDYVPLGELLVGTTLRTAGGGEARVASMDVRRGDFEVFNFEVEGVHNYYVQGPGGAGDAVLVHNGCGKITPELPALDSTGKVHGDLPEVQDLGDFATDEVEILADDLRQSVQTRIETTVEMGSDAGHGERLGAEQDLLKSVEKHLEDRK